MPQSLTLVVTGAAPGRIPSMGPKPLWPVTDHETVFDCQIRVLNRHCTERPVVVGGFMADEVRRGVEHVASVVENRHWESLGCGCSAQVGIYHSRPGRVLITHGDVVYSPVEIPPSGSWVVATEVPGRDCGEVGVVRDQWVTHLDYGVKPRWAQMVILDAHERRLFQDLPLRRELLHEAVNQTIDRGGRFGLHAPSGLKIIDVDRAADAALARELWANR